MKNITITINACNKEYVEELVSKFNKKINKLQDENLKVDFSDSYYKEFKDDDNVKKVLECIDVTIHDNKVFIINGYKIIAKLDHDREEKNLVKPYVELNEQELTKYEALKPSCQHCNSNRQRKTTYMLQNTKDNTCIQVGKSCLKDYVGHDILRCINYYDLMEEIKQQIKHISISNNTNHFEVNYEMNQIFKMIEMEIEKHGYCSKKDVLKGIADKTTAQYVIDNYLDKKVEITTADEQKYIELKEYVKNMKNENMNDYLTNLKMLLRHNYCKKRDIYLLSSIFKIVEVDKSIQRNKQLKEQEREQEKNNSDYVGSIGDKVEIEVTLKNKFNYDTNWGTSTIYLFTDCDKNIYKWNTSTYINKLKIDDTIKIKGTIKDHIQYDGVKQTVLTRVKEVIDKKNPLKRQIKKLNDTINKIKEEHDKIYDIRNFLKDNSNMGYYNIYKDTFNKYVDFLRKHYNDKYAILYNHNNKEFRLGRIDNLGEYDTIIY